MPVARGKHYFVWALWLCEGMLMQTQAESKRKYNGVSISLFTSQEWMGSASFEKSAKLSARSKHLDTAAMFSRLHRVSGRVRIRPSGPFGA